MPEMDGAARRQGQSSTNARELRRFLLFLVVGALNTAFGYAVFAGAWLVTGNSVASIIIGNVVGASFNYMTTGRIVFANRGFKALIPFLFGYVIVLCANLAIVEALKTYYGLSALVAGAICLPVLVLLSYGYNRLVVFRTSAASPPANQQ